MTVSEFLNNEISPLLLGAFFSRYKIDGGNIISTYTSYKNSKFVADNTKYTSSRKSLLDKFNIISAPCTWSDTSTRQMIELTFTLQNDLKLNTNSFYNRLYLKIMGLSYIQDEAINDSKKMFIRGFIESRGSIDTARPFIANDYFYNSNAELKRARMLYDYLNVPFNALNFNPRELQAQYVSGKNKRNTQLRINLWWYLSNIGLINDYKIEIIKSVYTNLTISRVENGITFFHTPTIPHGKKDSFDYRVNFYANNIIGKDLQAIKIKELRTELGFNDDPEQVFKRNSELIKLYQISTPDKCACCGTEQTYTHKNTGKQYFEVHHIISIGQNAELDDEDNLCKLCPTCHRLLKRGSASEQDQKLAIIKIINNLPSAKAFVESISETSDFNKMVDFVWRRLK